MLHSNTRFSVFYNFLEVSFPYHVEDGAHQTELRKLTQPIDPHLGKRQEPQISPQQSQRSLNDESMSQFISITATRRDNHTTYTHIS